MRILPVAASASRIVRFHVEHIVARQHGGRSEPEIWRWRVAAAISTRGRTSPALIPTAARLVPLFHPRQHRWSEHFAWEGTIIVGLTPIGRATVELLAMNKWERVEVRENLQSLGEPFAG